MAELSAPPSPPPFPVLPITPLNPLLPLGFRAWGPAAPSLVPTWCALTHIPSLFFPPAPPLPFSILPECSICPLCVSSRLGPASSSTSCAPLCPLASGSWFPLSIALSTFPTCQLLPSTLPHPSPPSPSSLFLSPTGRPRRCRDVHHRSPWPPCKWFLPFWREGWVSS